MPSESLTTEQVLIRLAETPPRLAVLTARLDSVHLQTRPAPGEWSANDVLAHLRACADVWGGYILRILAEDRPTFRAVSPRTWIKQTNYPELDFGPSLQAFTTQRAELLTVLNPLSPDGWSRAATVTTVGRELAPTVLSYAERLAIHERSHIKHVARIVATLSGEHGPAVAPF